MTAATSAAFLAAPATNPLCCESSLCTQATGWVSGEVLNSGAPTRWPQGLRSPCQWPLASALMQPKKVLRDPRASHQPVATRLESLSLCPYSRLCIRVACSRFGLKKGHICEYLEPWPALKTTPAHLLHQLQSMPRVYIGPPFLQLLFANQQSDVTSSLSKWKASEALAVQEGQCLCDTVFTRGRQWSVFFTIWPGLALTLDTRGCLNLLLAASKDNKGSMFRKFMSLFLDI